MREMHWSWAQLQETPIDVRESAWAFIQMERTAAAEQSRKAQQDSEKQRGVIRVAR